MTGIISFVVLIICILTYLRLPMFGAVPAKDEWWGKNIKTSPHYRNGQFQNDEDTPLLTTSTLKSLKRSFLQKKVRLRPKNDLPAVKTDLKNLDSKEDILVWFGHSSFFIQLDGVRMLIDPVFSTASSPILLYPTAFKGTSIYSVADLPDIDYVLISHDHWDHLDYKTMLELKPKVKKVITGLGVGAHLERWGYNKDSIVQMDWNQSITIKTDFTIHSLPARHFSGRGFKRNQSLWISFMIASPDFNLYISGDSGYGNHFAEIGQKFGRIDLAVMDSGQHDKDWKYVHMMSDEVVKATKDLKAKTLFMGHLGRFCISNHPWDEPYIEITEMSKGSDYSTMTPIIGEKVNLRDKAQAFSQWWAGRE